MRENSLELFGWFFVLPLIERLKCRSKNQVSYEKPCFVAQRSNSRRMLMLRSMFTMANLILRQWLSLLSFNSINIHSDVWACDAISSSSSSSNDVDSGAAAVAAATTIKTTTMSQREEENSSTHVHRNIAVQFDGANKKKKRTTIPMLKETQCIRFMCGTYVRLSLSTWLRYNTESTSNQSQLNSTTEWATEKESERGRILIYQC